MFYLCFTYTLLCFAQAEEDNPDPGKLAPAAVIGWECLKERLVEQQKEMHKMAAFVAVRGGGKHPP